MKFVPRIPLIIVLDNVRSAYNVGSILRTADCAWIEQVITCGYTPPAHHPKVKKTSLGAERVLHSQHFPTLGEAIHALRMIEGLQIYSMELTTHAESVWSFSTERITQHTALIFGNEVDGVQLSITRQHSIPELKLPQFGTKHSLNVATAASIAIYHWRYRAMEAGGA